jgi:methyl-accepting chemotaxis protein
MANQNLNFTITAKDLTRGTFRKLNQSLGLVRKALFNFKVGLTAVAGAAGIGLLVKSSLQSIDTLGKTAQKLGVTSQALQKLRYASNLAGVETRTVDMAVQRFTRRLSEAANGTGEAKDALKELGLNAKELAKQPLDKQMLKLADAFDNVQSSGDKVRLAFKLFDSEGVAFVNTLEGGSAALKEMFQEAEGLGFILSSGAVKGVEETNDAMMKLGVMLGGVRDQIVAGLAPAFRLIVDLIRNKLVDAIKGENGMGKIEDFAKTLAINVIDFVEDIAESLQGFADRTRTVVNFMIAAARAMGGITLNKTLVDLKDVGKLVILNRGFFQDLRDAVNTTSAATDIFNKKTETGIEKTQKYSEALQQLKDAAEKVGEGMGDAAVRGIKSLEDALVDLSMGTTSVKDAFKSMAKSIIADLIRLQIQQNITKPLSNMLSGMFGAPAGGTAPQAKAIGGSVRANSPYMVGENGRELFVPNSSGSIVPNNKLGGGGVTVNQTINLSAGVSQTVRAEVMGMLPQIQEASKAAVLDARRRGGSFSAAFG